MNISPVNLNLANWELPSEPDSVISADVNTDAQPDSTSSADVGLQRMGLFGIPGLSIPGIPNIPGIPSLPGLVDDTINTIAPIPGGWPIQVDKPGRDWTMPIPPWLDNPVHGRKPIPVDPVPEPVPTDPSPSQPTRQYVWQGKHFEPDTQAGRELNDGLPVTTSKTVDGKSIKTVPYTVESEHPITQAVITKQTTYGDGNEITDKQIVIDTTANTQYQGYDCEYAEYISKADSVQISLDPTASSSTDVVKLVCTVNGEVFKLEVPKDQSLTIRTGGGNDTIKVDSDVKVNCVLEGGDDNDTITGGGGNNTIEGGTGDDILNGGAGGDYISGGKGNDRIEGGDGNNVLYGGTGDDKVFGGAGNDYIEGGSGNDDVRGYDGDDILSGGTGDNAIGAGNGKDVVYSNNGVDTISNMSGQDKVFRQGNQDDPKCRLVNPPEQGNAETIVNYVPANELGKSAITVEGSDDFKEKVNSDLEMLRCSSAGTKMLEHIDQAYTASKGFFHPGHTITIKELQNEENAFASRASGDSAYLKTNGQAGSGTNAEIFVNPRFLGPFPNSALIMYHEMGHAYNFISGTTQPGEYKGGNRSGDLIADQRDIDNKVGNSERQEVGLPSDGVEHDWGDGRGRSRDMPYELTENGLRTEFKLDLRPSYALP